MSNSDYASKQLNKIRNRIVTAALEAGRSAQEIRLIGAAKMHTPAHVEQFVAAGLRDIGENYIAEGVARQSQLAHPELCWHFIGKLQSNKTRLLAQHYDWVHGLDKLKHARRLANQLEAGKVLQVLIQLNLDDEASKGGLAPAPALELAGQIAELEGLQLRGFMLLPAARADFSEQRSVFAHAREVLERCNQQHSMALDTLSMGMSGDLEAAIMEGSTMVRIGTDLFGARPVTPSSV